MYRSPEDRPRMRLYRSMMKTCIRVEGCIPKPPTIEERGIDMGACCGGCAEGKGCEGEGGCGSKKKHNHDKENNHSREGLRRVKKVKVGNAGYYSRVQAANLFPRLGLENHEKNKRAYTQVMGGALANHLANHTTLQKSGEFLYVTHRHPTNNAEITVKVPFAPILSFCQRMALLYGQDGVDRPNTVMGYAPIIALITSQLATKKLKEVEETAKKDLEEEKPVRGRNAPPYAPKAKEAKEQKSTSGPLDLSALFASIPGLSAMMGVDYGSPPAVEFAKEKLGCC